MVTCFEIAQYKPNGKKNDSFLTNIFLILILGSTNCQILPNFGKKTMFWFLNIMSYQCLISTSLPKGMPQAKWFPKCY